MKFNMKLCFLSCCLMFSQAVFSSATDPQVKSRHNSEHFVWGKVCDGWWLKDTGSFTIISESMPPNSTETKHYHHETEQFIYVTAGQLSIEIDHEQYILNKDEGITLPVKIPHNMWNHSKERVDFLVISGPKIKTDRINL